MRPPPRLKSGRSWKSLNKTGTDPSTRIRIGRVVGVHGIKGEVKAILELDGPEVLEQAPALQVGGRKYELIGFRYHKRHYLLQLAEIRDRDQALALIGQDIWLESRWLPALAADEYYWHQIIGLEVYQAGTDEYLGQIAAIIPTPAHDVYVVRRGPEEFLVPAVAAVILTVDLEQGRLVIAPEGWVAAGGAD